MKGKQVPYETWLGSDKQRLSRRGLDLQNLTTRFSFQAHRRNHRMLTRRQTSVDELVGHDTNRLWMRHGS